MVYDLAIRHITDLLNKVGAIPLSEQMLQKTGKHFDRNISNTTSYTISIGQCFMTLYDRNIII